MSDDTKTRTIVLPDLSGEVAPDSVLARLEAKLDWLAQAMQKLPDVRAAMEPMWIENASSPYPPSLPPYPEKP